MKQSLETLKILREVEKNLDRVKSDVYKVILSIHENAKSGDSIKYKEPNEVSDRGGTRPTQ